MDSCARATCVWLREPVARVPPEESLAVCTDGGTAEGTSDRGDEGGAVEEVHLTGSPRVEGARVTATTLLVEDRVPPLRTKGQRAPLVDGECRSLHVPTHCPPSTGPTRGGVEHRATPGAPAELEVGRMESRALPEEEEVACVVDKVGEDASLGVHIRERPPRAQAIYAVHVRGDPVQCLGLMALRHPRASARTEVTDEVDAGELNVRLVRSGRGSSDGVQVRVHDVHVQGDRMRCCCAGRARARHGDVVVADGAARAVHGVSVHRNAVQVQRQCGHCRADLDATIDGRGRDRNHRTVGGVGDQDLVEDRAAADSVVGGAFVDVLSTRHALQPCPHRQRECGGAH